jgi:hypothetical protein
MDIIAKLINWINVEPTVGLLMLITAFVLFASGFKSYQESTEGFWPWLRQIIESTVKASLMAVLFVGLMWAFRIILNDNVATFYSTHGSLSDASRASAQTIWGRPYQQIELTVGHTHEIQVQEEQPRADLTQPATYKTVTQIEEVPQNSIVGFVGDVKMNLSEREKGYAYYSGFVVDVALHYDVVNDSNITTDAAYTFPLSSGQALFESFVIKMDGQDMSPKLRIGNDIVSWTVKMVPHQQSKIDIAYKSRGMDYFYYQIPVQREIKAFALTLSVDRLPVSLLNYPDGVITPTQVQPTNDGQGSILTWRLDHAITVAGMGVALLPPQQPGAQVLRVLVISPYALTLLGAMLALTMLIWGQKMRFLDLALLAGVYSVQFLVMAALSDFFFGFWGSMIVGALLTLFLSFLLFRSLPSRALRSSIYSLVAFFTVVYPLSGLLTELGQQNAFNTLVEVGLILYIVGLSLFVNKRAPQAG